MNQLYEGYYVCPCGRIYSYKKKDGHLDKTYAKRMVLKYGNEL